MLVIKNEGCARYSKPIDHFTARADGSHATLVFFLKNYLLKIKYKNIQKLVRFFADCQINTHAPPLVNAPVNLLKFQSCDRNPQAEYLTR